MIGRLIRWWHVAVVAWALRHGVPQGQIMEALVRAFPSRDLHWRADLIADACYRNNWRRMARHG